MHCIFALLLMLNPQDQDELILLNGKVYRGKFIDETKTSIRFEVRNERGSRRKKRFRKKTVHMLVVGGEERIINPWPEGKPKPDRSPPRPTRPKWVKRSQQQVLAIIQKEGSSPPSWWKDVKLNYPQSLDLNWPDPPKGTWNNQKYVGHYIWDVINPNESRWKEGIRFLHHALSKTQNNKKAQNKLMNQLGTCYCSLMEDWARAAFWWRKAGSGTSGGMGQGGFRVGLSVGLARCYWELGCQTLAEQELNKVRRFNSGAVHLWARMGKHDKALQMTEAQAKSKPGGAWLTCGDLCRRAGKYPEALSYYRKAEALDPGRYQRVVQEAKDRILAVKAFETLDLKKIPDGKYRDKSMGYVGWIHVEVTVKDHRITDVKVTQHHEKQYYSSISDTTAQIIDKQAVKGVDTTSGATITSVAIISASAKALAAAMK